MAVRTETMIGILISIGAACVLPTANVQAASPYPFVPAEFNIPQELETREFRLRMLTVNDVVKDYDAAMTSVKHLAKVWPGSGWPKGLTLEQDLIDLGWHQREFQDRNSFAYTVVNLSDSEVLGCVYVNPTRKAGYDAEVYLWVRQSEFEKELDPKLMAAVQSWLKKDWPFKKVGFPGREIEWKAWETISDVKR
jgi:hypothetical protein